MGDVLSKKVEEDFLRRLAHAYPPSKKEVAEVEEFFKDAYREGDVVGMMPDDSHIVPMTVKELDDPKFTPARVVAPAPRKRLSLKLWGSKSNEEREKGTDGS